MRTSGVVMPIFSLPSDFGIGTLGRDACDFIDFLAAADVHVWEIMPICHTDSSFSPHNALCARAGNPLLIDLQPFVDCGVFSSRELSRMDWGRDRAKISYPKVAAAKYKALEMVFDALGSQPDSKFGWRTMPSLPPSMSSSSVCRFRSGARGWPIVSTQSWIGCASGWIGTSGFMNISSTCSTSSGGSSAPMLPSGVCGSWGR